MLQRFDERNRNILININGELRKRGEAGISPFDSVVQGGDAVWEGLRLYDGRIFKLLEHLERLRQGAKALAFAEIPARDAIVAETLTRGEKVTSGMDPRLNQSGPTLIVLAEHKAPVYDKGGLRLTTSSVRRFPPDCLDPKIHHANLVQSILAKIEANAAGADDAVMLDRRGFVAETNATHLFAVADGTLLTPHTHACPEGITRATVLELCAANDIPVRVTDLSLAEFHRAAEVFCTGTMGELAAVVEIDGRTIGSGGVGPMTTRLGELYRAETATRGFPILEEGT